MHVTTNTFVRILARSVLLAAVSLLPANVANSEDRPPVVLTDAARALHAKTILVDGHNDLPWAFREMGTPSFDKVDIAKSQPKLHTDIPRLREGGVKAQFWSVYVPSSTRLTGESLQATLEQIEFVHNMVKQYPDTFSLCLTMDDVDQAIADGKIASMIGMEGGHSIENSISVLRRLYSLGARYMTLTHSATLDWADSATDEAKHGGLTKFGEEVVLEMNRLGMLVDLSHVSDDTMRDAMRISQAPIIYSHSSARAIGDHPRNVPDNVLPLIKENGGVIMVNFYPGFVVPAAAERSKQRDKQVAEWEQQYDEAKVKELVARWEIANPVPQGSIHDVVNHIDHLVKNCGIDHVGIGSDYDGIGTVPKQLEDVSTYPLITQEMLNRGYSAEDIHKVMGQNVMRVFRQAEKVAKRMQVENN
ncbi:MAG: dipeptidase [Planctomycetales bacterium]|nr:dipeptidase [Planctomycetales bacterium]